MSKYYYVFSDHTLPLPDGVTRALGWDWYELQDLLEEAESNYRDPHSGFLEKNTTNEMMEVELDNGEVATLKPGDCLDKRICPKAAEYLRLVCTLNTWIKKQEEIQNQNKPSAMKGLEFRIPLPDWCEPLKKANTGCECGAASVRGLHSSWCPMGENNA